VAQTHTPLQPLRIADIALIQRQDLPNIAPWTPDMLRMLDSTLAAQKIA
jgi:hypothetical protein